MQQNTPEQNYYQEDEIDLKELFKTLWLKKNLIIRITTAITILAGVYAFTKTPAYEATALVEVGNYKSQNNNRKFIDSTPELSKKLNYLYIKPFEKSNIERDSEIVSISMPKKTKNFIVIRSEAISNQLAAEEINGIIKHIQKEHGAILSDIKQNRESSIKVINRKILELTQYKLITAGVNIEHLKTIELAAISRNINFIQTVQIPDIKTKILSLEGNVLADQKSLDKGYQNLDSIEGHPALASLRLNKLQFLENRVFSNKNKIIDLDAKKINLQTNKLKALEDKKISLLQVKLPMLKNNLTKIKDQLDSLNEDKIKLQSLLLSHNYKNTDISGQIITNDKPIKPKKILIVIVAFIAGFILSIFLVFIMNAFRKEDEKATA
jgi:LPS O-antigen subunit length determinant protein (WzzB/FepE family)